jgi:hypothetical protein
MKTLILAFSVTLVIYFLTGCGDDNPTNNNNNPPCTKSCNLQLPPNDTTLGPPYDSLYFAWNKASCNPVQYKWHLLRDTVAPWYFYREWNLTDTSYSYTGFLEAGFNYQWWVTAYYGSPVNDSFVTQTFHFFK